MRSSSGATGNNREGSSAIEDHSAGILALDRAEGRWGRPVKGLNFFKRTEQQLPRALLHRPRFNVSVHAAQP